MATYIRLTDYKSSDEKEQEFFNPENRYEAKQEEFNKIPGNLVAYWMTKRLRNILLQKRISEYGISSPGIRTGKDAIFIKEWYEVSTQNISFNASSHQDIKNSTPMYYPITRGGESRKWYGNLFNIIKIGNDANEIQRICHDHRLREPSLYFKEGITWTMISSTNVSFRIVPVGVLFGNGGPCLYIPNTLASIAFLNTNISQNILNIFNPTLNYTKSDIDNLPNVDEKNSANKIIYKLAQQNIDISKEEWNSRETSWDFTKSELLKYKSNTKIETAFSNYCEYWSEKFVTLHKNEEELNRLFIDIYELQDELDKYVKFKDITILKNETTIEVILIPPSTKEEVDERGKTAEGYLYNRGANLVFKADEIMKQFISYGVGVMFGRYSLDTDGLLIANMGQYVPNSLTYEIDDDNVIPVLEDEYFNDDIAARFVEFVKVAFGEESLSENINFIEECLGKNIRKYFVKDFYEDHIKRYKKRPIYWMVSSPKKSFNALFYMHRYESDIFARVQNSYLREYITKLEATKQTQTKVANDESNSATDRRAATKDVDDITRKLEEIIKYDRDNLTVFAQNGQDIDLDDGVKVNYCRFEDILYPIKGLCKK